MSGADHDRVSAAVLAAEAGTSGEIVTVVAERSDGYSDLALIYAALAALLVPFVFAVSPALPLALVAAFSGGWGATGAAELMLLTAAALVAVFALAYVLLKWRPLRLALVPRAVRRRRVRARAVDLFRVAAEGRTTGRTGILLYLSLGERMAEIVADGAIHGKVDDAAWGEAMAALVGEVRHGRIADGMIAAIGHVGAILARHLPRADGDVNELSDRLVEL